MTSRAALPVDVDELTPQWFSAVLQRDVTDATVVDRSSGTTGRARVALRGEAGVPATVFVKLPPFDEMQRAFVAKIGMGVTEARFYRDLAADVPVRVPGVWFADADDDRDDGGYVMVLEDLAARGCRFPSPDDDDIEARALDIVEQLALLHARFWASERFAPDGDLHWLADRAARAGGAGRQLIAMAVDSIGDQMDETFHRLARIYLANAEEITRLWTEGAGTLVHGDSHMGNLYVDPADGNGTGFLDWAVLCRAPGMRDVAYTLTNSVPEQVRIGNERAWIERYRQVLATNGVRADGDELWDQYRLFAVYSWVSATATAGMGSKWQPIEIGMQATRRTTLACAQLDSAGLLEALLG
jgi:hypothetical protein